MVVGFLLPELCERGCSELPSPGGVPGWSGQATTLSQWTPSFLEHSAALCHPPTSSLSCPGVPLSPASTLAPPCSDPTQPLSVTHTHGAALSWPEETTLPHLPLPRDQVTVMPPRERETGWKWFRNVPRVIPLCKQRWDPGWSCPKAHVPTCFHTPSCVSSHKDPKCPVLKSQLRGETSNLPLV